MDSTHINDPFIAQFEQVKEGDWIKFKKGGIGLITEIDECTRMMKVHHLSISKVKWHVLYNCGQYIVL